MSDVPRSFRSYLNIVLEQHHDRLHDKSDAIHDKLDRLEAVEDGLAEVHAQMASLNATAKKLTNPGTLNERQQAAVDAIRKILNEHNGVA
jgi:hypothetical protein